MLRLRLKCHSDVCTDERAWSKTKYEGSLAPIHTTTRIPSVLIFTAQAQWSQTLNNECVQKSNDKGK